MMLLLSTRDTPGIRVNHIPKGNLVRYTGEKYERAIAHLSSSSSSDPKLSLVRLYIFKIVLLSLKLPSSGQFRSGRYRPVQIDPVPFRSDPI